MFEKCFYMIKLDSLKIMT